jgi:hypothetical protein
MNDGPYGSGNVFRLTPSGGSWTYTSLYDFSGGNDGAVPICNVIFDADGNLYGTTYYGGANAPTAPAGALGRPEGHAWHQEKPLHMEVANTSLCNTDCSSTTRFSITPKTSAPNRPTSFLARTGPMPLTRPLLKPVLFVPNPPTLGLQPLPSRLSKAAIR